MKITPKTAATAKALLLHLQDHIAADPEAAVAPLRRVATGEFDMPETLSDEERTYARTLFGWLAATGPDRVLHALLPSLETILDQDGDTPDEVKETNQQAEQAAFGRLFAEATAAGFPMPPHDELNRHGLTRLALLLVSYLYFDEFHLPHTRTGVYDIAHDMFEKAKWAYRYWFNQLELAAAGSGLEQHFAAQDLHFPGPADAAGSAVSVTCAGDLLAVDVLVPEHTPHLFDGIADFYSTADIVSANLESTVDAASPVGRTQAPGQAARMNTSEAMFAKFRDEAKINFFSTATNHSLDWGEQGVLATLGVLGKSGAAYSGTAASQAGQDDVVVIERNGIKIALLTYTFDLNGYHLPADKPYLVNQVRFNDVDPAPDLALVRGHVAAAKAKGAEYILAYCHWGWEFETYPHPNVVAAAHAVIDCGVDTILGNHPHVSQPMERVVRDGRPDGLIVYAFGDFVSYHPESRNSKLALAVRFDVVADRTSADPRPYLANLRVLPMYIVNARRDDGTFDCRIVKFADVLADPGGYGLTDLERDQLPHLDETLLRGRLLPRDAAGLLAE